jgi:hypothetical protein
MAHFASLNPPQAILIRPTSRALTFLRERFVAATMSRSPSPSQTIRPSLVRLALAILAAAVAILRGRWEREMLRPLMHPDHRTRITRDKFRSMMAAMFRDDARLRREIFEAAMRMLGREIPVLADSAFALPRPETARGLWRRWSDYARMVNHAEWYARRLARKLARLGCDACRFDQSTPEGAAPGEAGRAAPLLAADGVATAPEASRSRAQSRIRAPPCVLTASFAPCKRSLAGSPAHA